ncbi:MAG: hypothetical protein KDI51_19395, partial [Xanthomonadales bacterium]|nr:hypothetical protein [Xanthomonadales bacterium]
AEDSGLVEQLAHPEAKGARRTYFAISPNLAAISPAALAEGSRNGREPISPFRRTLGGGEINGGEMEHPQEAHSEVAE